MYRHCQGEITINRKRLYAALAVSIMAGSISIYNTRKSPDKISEIHSSVATNLDSKMNFGNFLIFKDENSVIKELNLINSKKSILALENQKVTNTNQNVSENKLKAGTTSEEVKQLQTNLKKLGFFTSEITGFYGDITASAVQNFQKSHDLAVTGEANTDTLDKLNYYLTRPIYVASRGSDSRDTSQDTSVNKTATKSSTSAVSVQPSAKGGVQMMQWFGGVENIFSIGSIATVTDLNTGLAFKIKRTYGYNHADNETLTAQDTAIMKKAAGGSWNWTRRPVIVEVNGYKFAASMAPFPHAGRDDKPANATVSNRSGDYGTGDNLDSVKGNNMDGHFDIHFLGSKTHGSNSVDANHQAAVKKAYEIGNR